jgi:hypothetical protein
MMRELLLRHAGRCSRRGWSLQRLLEWLERRDDVAHERPCLGVAAEAVVREHGDLVHGPGRQVVVAGDQPGIHDPHGPLLVRQHRERPVGECLLPRRAGPVQRPPPGEQLQQHDAIGVHVAHRREVARHHVLGRGVAVGAHHAGGDVGAVAHGPGLGEPEVRELGGEALVQQDVGRLEVAVDHGGLRLVEERQPARCAQRDPHSRRPGQRRRRAGEEVGLHAAQGRVLVHQDAVLALAAVAHQLHQVRVGKLTEKDHLRLLIKCQEEHELRLMYPRQTRGKKSSYQPLAVALEAVVAVVDLDCDRQRLVVGGARRGALVHAPEAAASDQRVLPELVGHLPQLRVREGHQRVPNRRRRASPQGLHLAGVRRQLALVAPVPLRRALDLGSLCCTRHFTRDQMKKGEETIFPPNNTVLTTVNNFCFDH